MEEFKIDKSQIDLVFDLGREQVVQAVWYYYGEGLTQAKVAQILGVSRTTVANLLSSGRKQGLVKITLDPNLLDNIKTARSLKKITGLEGAHVVPVAAESSTNDIRSSLARAAAHILGTCLSDQIVLGVASGRTMAALGEEIPKCHYPGLRVVQVSGSSLGDKATSPEACTLRIASRLGAQGYNFLAPAVVTSEALKNDLLKEPALVRQFKRIRNCTIAVFSVGELTSETTWADSDELTQAAVPEYVKKNAAGVILGRFIDKNGKEITGPLSGCQVGASIADLLAIPTRICVAGGKEKTDALRAAISGKLMTHLVTDNCTAGRLMKNKT